MYMIIIIVYFIICLLILFYTISYIFYQSYYDFREAHHIRKFTSMISDQHRLVRDSGYIDRNHRNLLSKRLKKTNQLIAFEKALNQLEKGDTTTNTLYLKQLEPVILELVIHYRFHDQMIRAYLAYFIATYAKDNWRDPFIFRTLFSYMDDATIYLRQNVLLAMYQQPDPKLISKAFHYLTENNLFHHAKLIQDGLLKYPYDYETLIDTLWKESKTFHLSIVLGLIGFITYRSDRYKDTFYRMLQEKQVDLEIKTRLMRYFKKHHDVRVEPLLVSMASDINPPIRIVAVNVLSEYPSEKVIATLNEALTDDDWYVRRNASQSLLAMNVSNLDDSDVLVSRVNDLEEVPHYHLSVEGGVNR
ncbi:HEAT repeat domain-containing protein [Ornithinibacillus californiensis]|uniref:HEAT repeat domain-containing protein n=1 Tax=Ornithinibacillus californiensis TaxID=161536 RepID=UPI00064DDFFA|nr:HEAT repeat domain-containing protein [Ornithinibacillus californiensis]